MYRDIWILMLVSSFFCFFLGLVLVFMWKIPDTLDELSGKKAKRQIKMMRELNSSTGAFENMSTRDIYSGIPSGSLIDNDSINIMSSELEDTSDMFFNKDSEDLGDYPTSYMGTSESKTTVLEDLKGTEVIDDDSETKFLEEEPTDFMDVGNILYSNIEVLEEQSSL